LDAGREGERLAEQRRLALALLERGGERQLVVSAPVDGMRDLHADGLDGARYVELAEGILHDLRLRLLVVHRRRRIVRVERRAVAQLHVVGNALGEAERAAQHVAVADEIARLAEERERLLAEARRELVVERDAEVVARRLSDARPEHRLARPRARRELGVDSRHEWIAQQDLQAFLQVDEVERWPGVKRDTVAEVALAEMLRALDVDCREPALDDADLDHAVADRLVGDHRTRVHVAVVHVIERELAAQLFEIGAADRPVLVRRGDLRQLRVAHRRVAADPELAHDNARHERHAPGLWWWQRRQLQNLRRGLTKLRRWKRLLRGQRLRRKRRGRWWRGLAPGEADRGEQTEAG